MPFKTYLLRVYFLDAYFPKDKTFSQHLMKAHLAKFFIGFRSNHCYAFAFYWLKI